MNNILRKLAFLSLLAFSSLVWAQAPSNDECTGAIDFGTLPAPGACDGSIQDGAAVTMNSQTTANATGASPYVYLTGCSGGGDMQAPALDTWYSFTASGSTLNMDISGFSNASIGLWGGTCAVPVGQGCANVGGSGNASFTFTSLTIGSTYYIQISGGNATATDSDFSITLDNDIDCNDCLITSSLTASPLPVNGTYLPGQVVTFCYTVSNWVETNQNWFHGVQVTMGAGWDGNITNYVAPAECGYNPPGPGAPTGSWDYYSSVTSEVTGQVFGEGFYFDNDSPASSDPGLTNSFGDATGGSCSWTSCWDLTVDATCVTAADLNVQINTSGDGESGGWTSSLCSRSNYKLCRNYDLL